MAENKNEEPTPRLVGVPGDDRSHKDFESTAPSSSDPQFFAQPHDGVWSPDHQAEVLGEPASHKEQMKAFAEYSDRPDIETRESILARENAYPGQFSNANVQSGEVTDGKARTATGSVKETKEAKAEAATVKDLTAKD
jgi:hypothetical protein